MTSKLTFRAAPKGESSNATHFWSIMSLISDGELRKQLQNFGFDVGPINNTTRNLYQKKLQYFLSKNRRAPGNIIIPHEASPVRVATGVKRARESSHEASPVRVATGVKRARESRERKQGRKRPRLNAQGHPQQFNLQDRPINAQAKASMYPDLSEWLTPPSSEPHSPSTTPKRISLQRSRVPEPQVSPSPNHHPRLCPPVSPPSRLQSDLSSFESSSMEDSLPSQSSPKPHGFFKTVGRLIESGVSKFLNIAEPRRTLKSPLGRKKIFNDSSLSLAAIKPDLELEDNDEIAEAVGITTSGPPLVYDWELQPTEVALCRKGDGSPWSLGSGGFGEVFKGLRDGVDEVAVKRMKISNCTPSVIAQFKAEIDLISKLRHRHIVQFYGACIQPPHLSMVTELMSNDLFSVLRLSGESERYKWTGIYGRKVLVGVAMGLNYLHSRSPPVVHRDIKSPNILVMDGVAKIADVGVARTMGASDMTAQRGFTMAWASPEVVYRRRATEKIDIWSMGVIMWEVVTGRQPKVGKLVLPVATSSPSLRELFSRCMSDNPTARPSAQKIISELRESE